MSDFLTLNHNELAQAIALTGHLEPALVEGDMGSGKSALHQLIFDYLKDHEPTTSYTMIYIDCTTKLDSGDSFMIKYSKDGATFHHVPHEELGLYLDGPCIIMFDELGKCSRSYQLSVRRFMLERIGAGKKANPKTIIFATTNLGMEGVGDLIPAHHLDSMTLFRLRKPSHIESVEYGSRIGVDPIILQCIHDHPEWSHSFTDYLDGDGRVMDNCPTAIYQPHKEDQGKFYTPRGGMRCDVWVKARHELNENQLRAALVGKLGREAGTTLATYVELHDKLVTDKEIQADPHGCKIPSNKDGSVHAGATCMVVYRILNNIERFWSDEALTFIQRLPNTAQSLFFNTVNNGDYMHADVVHQNTQYRIWCDANAHQLAPTFTQVTANPLGDTLCKRN